MRLMSERYSQVLDAGTNKGVLSCIRCQANHGPLVIWYGSPNPIQLARLCMTRTVLEGGSKLSGTLPGSTAVATRCCKTQHLITV